MNMADFQNDFIGALYGAAPLRADIAAAAAQHGFAVYRNTVLKACRDNLAANFPSVLQLVGADWFAGVAGAYAAAEPPRCVSLFEYGAGFPHFLRQPASEAGLPYLPGVALLDRLWIESHMAADQPALAASALAACSPRQLGELRLAVHAAARWAAFGEAPAFAIWAATREQRAYDNSLPWLGDGGLLTRPAGEVRWQALDTGARAFLDACAGGATLHQAAAQALACDPGLDIAATLAALIGAGAFRSLPSQPT